MAWLILIVIILVVSVVLSLCEKARMRNKYYEARALVNEVQEANIQLTEKLLQKVAKAKVLIMKYEKLYGVKKDNAV